LLSGLTTTMAPAQGDLLIGGLEGDDAAVLRLDDDRALVLTTDFFTPIVDDPFDWGRIAAANALSDVYAMGGNPILAINVAAWPGDTLPMEMLAEVIRGGAELSATVGCPVVGGHTVDDAVPKFGMCVLGMAHPDRLFAIDKLAVGDRLVLTKAIGTGVISSALKQQAAPAASVEAAVSAMATVNADASEAAHRAGVRAATDVTGFGLIGHLHRMLVASGTAADLVASQVPLLPGAADLVAAGHIPGGTRANIDHHLPVINLDPSVSGELAVLLHDAQTSGGLLLAVGDDLRADLVVSELRELGHPAAVVGTVTAVEPLRAKRYGDTAVYWGRVRADG
jgi:selenide,water dikinase